MTNFQNESYNPYSEEALKNEAARTLSDAELIKGGAKYVAQKDLQTGNPAHPRLELTKEQIDEIKQAEPTKLTTQENKKEEEWTHTFETYNNFWFGKPNPREDFKYYQKDGKRDPDRELAAARLVQEVLDSRHDRLVAINNFEGKRNVFYASGTSGIDAAGRRMAAAWGAETSTNINPMEQLFYLYFNPPKTNDLIKEGEIIDTKSRGEFIKKEFSTPVPPQEINKALIAIIYGERVEIGNETFYAIAKMKNIVPYIPWIVLSYESIKGLASLNKPILCVVNKPSFYTDNNLRDFIKLVNEKIGNKDAQFGLLFQGIPDNTQRRHVLEAYCKNELAKLTPEHKGALDWIKAIGTAEEIRQAEAAFKQE